ncbi:LysR family transcriptional regulator [Nocardioides rotundus]|uniref:LysR family transcriptional regulator n=1 Tax=Nocardioides rotundus TaxID=1774216 RepID=UPI001CBBE254|nr:LysR family transcriptional regulator [Nocardioides rotundus]UAL29315.1 LysR family transcriptional regulator [Nocardioides rotundus]
MDRRQLEYFLAVVDAGSFTAAARSHHISQPSLSHAIATLERTLGVRLFERLGRGVRLTAAGEALVAPARHTLRAFALAQGAVRSVGETDSGSLRIITTTLWSMEPLAQLVGTFRRLHPAVDFVIADPEDRTEVLEQLRAGDQEFGLVEGEVTDRSLRGLVLARPRLVAVLPPRALPGTTVVTPADLRAVGVISTPPGTSLHHLTRSFLGAGSEPIAPAVRTAHLASVVPMVLAGAGAALLPDRLAEESATRGVRVLPLQQEMKLEVRLVWRADGLGPLAEQFLALATAETGRPGEE